MASLSRVEELVDTFDAKEPDADESSPERVRAFEYRNQLIVASRFVLSRLGTAPIAIVLGSGLGGFRAMLDDIEEVPYSEIPYLPIPTVKGHSGKIIMGSVTSTDGKTKKRIMCFSGRLHTYEGLPMFQVTFCARLASLCGVHTLILTNAAGGCIPNQQAGSVVVTTDFIRDLNYTVLAHSANDAMFGPRHSRSDELLDRGLTELLIATAKETSFPNYSGVYWMCLGPCYETKEMVQFCIRCGAAAVGMSTVPSVLAAKNMGLRVAAMSLCTNVAAGLEDEELSHSVVVQNAKNAEKGFGEFVKTALLRMDDPADYVPPDAADGGLQRLRLNLTRLAMEADPRSADELLFPRKYLVSYHQQYTDIVSLRRLLSKVLDLSPSGHSAKGRPVAIWLLHDPFAFDAATLRCPLSVPLKALSGFSAISSTASADSGVLHFGSGGDDGRHLIVVVSGLTLSGMSFDECNAVINVLYGVLGHKNLYFLSLFHALPTATMYAAADCDRKPDGGDDQKQDDAVRRGEYAVIADTVDFKGGFPRFPRPLFPPKETNCGDVAVRMKYAVFGGDILDGFRQCLRALSGGDAESHAPPIIASYALYPGPSWPTPSELAMAEMARCPLSGISNQSMTPMARQLGHDGYSVAYIPTAQEFEAMTSSKGRCLARSLRKDVTSAVHAVSSAMVRFFESSKLLYSPAAMNRATPSVFAASAVSAQRLRRELMGNMAPRKTPQFQRIHSVDAEWAAIGEAAEWLRSVWDFEAQPVRNALLSSFGHVFDGKASGGGDSVAVSLDLAKMPRWNEHFCGGSGYSHCHWADDNPFEWTLRIVRRQSAKGRRPSFHFVVGPHFFSNGRMHSARRAYLAAFYKYCPMLWNMGFLLRVLRRVGAQNVAFLTHLMANDRPSAAKGAANQNQVVAVRNYIDCAKWSVLTGPNDERLGPRFTPITEPIELREHFLRVAASQRFRAQIESVVAVHIPATATTSPTSSAFYGRMGFGARCLGLVPEIQVAQHLALRKVAIGVLDYSARREMANVESFAQIIAMIEVLFDELDDAATSDTK